MGVTQLIEKNSVQGKLFLKEVGRSTMPRPFRRKKVGGGKLLETTNISFTKSIPSVASSSLGEDTYENAHTVPSNDQAEAASFACTSLASSDASMFHEHSNDQHGGCSSDDGGSSSDRSSAKIHLPFDKLGLYGRTSEVEQLQKAWELELSFNKPAKQSTQQQVVLVGGQAGSGKSALVATSLKQRVMNDGGFVIWGKYEQQQQQQQSLQHDHSGSNSSSGGIISACQDLCQTILEYKYDPTIMPSWKFTFDKIRSKLMTELSAEELQVLTRFMPRLKLIIAAGARAGAGNAPEYSSDIEHRKYLFDRAFCRFLCVIASFGPILFALDDLQWSDLESLELLKAIIMDPAMAMQAQSLLFVGIFRTQDDKAATANDDIESSILLNWIRDMESSQHVALSRFMLDNLAVHHIEHMLTDLFQSNKKTMNTRELAECTHRKTLGNAFFVGQFLRSLEKGKMLWFDHARGEWAWDISRLQALSSSTENVVDFMVSKLRTMPDHIQRHLPIVASLGTVFRAGLVELLVGEFGQEARPNDNEKMDAIKTTEKLLKVCKKEGLICHLREEYFQWEHDKLQEAALLLVERIELEALRFRMGTILLRKMHAAELDESVFVVANLLGHHPDVPIDDPMRESFSIVNLQAAQKAMTASSFQQAAAYLENGFMMLPPGRWESHYELTLELFSVAAEAEFINGEYEKTREYCQEILAKTTERPMHDKRRAFDALLCCYRASGLVNEGRKLCLNLLKNLGVRFPKTKRGIQFHVLGNIVGTRLSLKSTLEVISKLDDMTSDESTVMKMRLFHELLYFSYQCDRDLMPLVALRGYRLTAKGGILTRYTPGLLYTMGILSVVVEDFNAAKIYANAGLKLTERVDDAKSLEASSMFLAHWFVLHWQEPIEWFRKDLLKGFHAGMASGDTENGCWCIICYLELGFYLGTTNLDTLSRECQIYAIKVNGVQQRKIEQFTCLLWQTILNLTDSTSEKQHHLLRGDAVDINMLQIEAEKNADPHLLRQINLFRILAAFWFAKYREVLEIAKASGFDKDDYAEQSPAVYDIIPLAFVLSLSSFIVAQEEETTKGLKKCKKLGNFFLGKFRSWASKKNPNVSHLLAFLNAEAAVLAKRDDDAKKFFEEGLILARSRGCTNNLALGHERYGIFLLKRNRSNEARPHISSAIECYEDWGATARRDALSAQFSDLLLTFQPPPIEINMDNSHSNGSVE